MSTLPTTRRGLILGVAALGLGLVAPVARAQARVIHVLKDPGCGCCDDWIATLKPAGFAAQTELMDAETLARFKRDGGIPDALVSCHTGRIDGYLIEGHVPAADIIRLLDQRLEAVGLTVPGMPWGAPGMGPETEREAYDVFLIRRDGQAEVFARYGAA